MVFVNGIEIGKVIRIETPREHGQTGPRVILELGADVVIERIASDQEWRARKPVCGGAVL